MGFLCCVLRESMTESEMELCPFQRYSLKNVSVRHKINPSARRITGMAKFRTSQKLKRKVLDQLRLAEESKLNRRNGLCLQRSQSQPTLRTKNFTPYD